MNDLQKRENPYVGSRYASDVSLMAVISVIFTTLLFSNVSPFPSI